MKTLSPIFANRREIRLASRDDLYGYLRSINRALRKSAKKGITAVKAAAFHLRTLLPDHSAFFVSFFVAKDTHESYRYRVGNIRV